MRKDPELRGSGTTPLGPLPTAGGHQDQGERGRESTPYDTLQVMAVGTLRKDVSF